MNLQSKIVMPYQYRWTVTLNIYNFTDTVDNVTVSKIIDVNPFIFRLCDFNGTLGYWKGDFYIERYLIMYTIICYVLT
jgi:hypothetical protein